MRLTIIPSDGFVAVDGLSKVQPLDISSCNVPSDVHAFQWFENEGWIEFNDNDNNPLTPKPQNEIVYSLPEWAAACFNVWNDYIPPTPIPTPPTAEQNKLTAEQKLQQTDWTQIPSVSDPAQSNPYLTNSAAFATYRVFLREIAINPVAGNIDWGTMPSAVWSA